MAKYRKKPVVVEAVQFIGLGPSGNVGECMDFCGEHVDPEYGDDVLTFVPHAYPAPKLWVAANEAWLELELGEWIIRDRRGYYPCKPDIFEATYEPVDASD